MLFCFSDFDFVSKLVVGVPIKLGLLFANRETCFTLLFFDGPGRDLIKKDQTHERNWDLLDQKGSEMNHHAQNAQAF
jgi:hypothetical protein